MSEETMTHDEWMREMAIIQAQYLHVIAKGVNREHLDMKREVHSLPSRLDSLIRAHSDLPKPGV